MRCRLFLILFILCSLPTFIRSENIPLDSIKLELVRFLKDTEQVDKDYKVEYLSNFLIMEVKTGKAIDANNKGIFVFSTLSSVEYVHFLLIDDASFKIVNMKESYDENIDILLNFLEKNKEYSKDDIVFYLRELQRIFRLNKKTIRDHGVIVDKSDFLQN